MPADGTRAAEEVRIPEEDSPANAGGSHVRGGKKRGELRVEIWDAYDADWNRIEGKTLVRGRPIPEGIFHLVADVLVRHTDGSYLLMRRDPGKKYGGMWEATAGGAALKGETPAECAERELREETGIVASGLREVGRITSPEHRTLFAEFLCVTDWDKDSVTLQRGETVDYRWVSREELAGMDRKTLLTERMQGYVEELRR